jgi:hypothetical protein
MTFHQVIVDAYAAQHPGDGALPQQVQSVGLHLMTLCLFLEMPTTPPSEAACTARWCDGRHSVAWNDLGLAP